MKYVLLVLTTAWLGFGCGGWAQESETSPSPQAIAQYAGLVRAEYELNAQVALLKELAEMHTKRSADAVRSNAVANSNWETGTAREYETKAAALGARASQSQKERAALESAHKSLSLSLLANLPVDTTGGYTAREIAYLDKLEERSTWVASELASIVESRRLFSQQIQTNNVAEDIYRLNGLLEQTQREVRLLELERAELELKKLQFQALRPSRSP